MTQGDDGAASGFLMAKEERRRIQKTVELAGSVLEGVVLISLSSDAIDIT
jgi:hypothetical protein